jgi:hypothetical protein
MEAPKSKLERTEKNKLFKKGDAEEGTVAESISSEVNADICLCAFMPTHTLTHMRASRGLNSSLFLCLWTMTPLSKMRRTISPPLVRGTE